MKIKTITKLIVAIVVYSIAIALMEQTFWKSIIIGILFLIGNKIQDTQSDYKTPKKKK